MYAHIDRAEKEENMKYEAMKAPKKEAKREESTEKEAQGPIVTKDCVLKLYQTTNIFQLKCIQNWM